MEKNNFKFFFIFAIFFSLILIPNKVFAKTDTVYFKWNQTGDLSKINLQSLEKMKQIVYEKRVEFSNTGSTFRGTYEEFYNNYSFFVTYNSETSRFEFNTIGYDYIPLLSSYYSYSGTKKYEIYLQTDVTYYFDSNFNFLSWNRPDGYKIYTSSTYDHLKDKEDLFSMDFNIIAGNHDFKIFNMSATHKLIKESEFYDSSHEFSSSFVIINDYKIGSVYLSPFNEYGLLNGEDYSEKLTYTFKASDSTAVKIKYKVLEGSVSNVEYEVSNNWFKRFFGIKDKVTKTINIDNFNYYVVSNNTIKTPVRYYSDTDGKKFKRLPRDLDLLEGTSFSAEVNTLNYDDGVRSGYIYFDLSDVPSDTVVTLTVEYNPISMKFLGLEKTDSFDSLKEVNLKNNYGVALIPNFDISKNIYSFPLYYKGNVGFSYSGNFEKSKDNKFYSISQGNASEYNKYLIDFSRLSYIKVDKTYYYDFPYLYIRNFDINSDTYIRYNSDYFDILYFSNDDSCQMFNSHEYCSTNTDDWQWGTIDANGDGNSGTSFTPDDSDIVTIDPVGAIESIGSGASKVISLLVGGLTLLGKMIVSFRTILPSNVIFVLDAILTVTGFVIVINFIKKL